jgi:hypothetical protein
MSDTPGHHSDLSLRQGPSENPVARLSALWRHGQKPDLRAFLAGTGRLSDAELTDVLCTDQRERWLDGQRPAVEVYFELHDSHPESALPIDLIFDEFLVRRELRESATLDEYCQRFPNYAEQLRLHVRLYDTLGEVVPATYDRATGPGADTSTASHTAQTPFSGSEPPWAPALRGPQAGEFESDYKSFKHLLQDMAGEQSAATLLPLIARHPAGRPHVALARIWLILNLFTLSDGPDSRRPGQGFSTCVVPANGIHKSG